MLSLRMVWAWHEGARGVYVLKWVGEWIGEAIVSVDGSVGEAAAASAYVAGAGKVAAVSASAELEGLEQTVHPVVHFRDGICLFRRWMR